MIRTPSEATGSRLTWREIHERIRAEEEHRRTRWDSSGRTYHDSREGEAEGRRLYQSHL